MGDLNNIEAARKHVELPVDVAYQSRSFSIQESEDDAKIREQYRPFLLSKDVSESDWVSKLELSTVLAMVDREILAAKKERLKVLVLYGSLRAR